MRLRNHFLAVFGGSCACVSSLSGQSTASAAILKQMSLDELMGVEVTSVSRREEPYSEVAAALTVVTNEHIRRSGATALPDALRWVPGLHVARRNANSWAVSARGFASTNSEKLLVLSDSRSIYTPLFSGVFWDVQDYLLTDIERIEVIRGPGAALWGSNAVNGVINITTKHAADTHGLQVIALAGTEERATLGARYGAQLDNGVNYRVFGRFGERDSTFNPGPKSDDWRLAHAGFRTDWSPDPRDDFTVQGDFYRGSVGQFAPAVSVVGRPGPTGDLEAKVIGGNILGRWRHRLDADADIQFRAYYDRTHRDDPSFTDDLDTIDLDLQHRFAPIARHALIWGTNYRHTINRNRGKGVLALQPARSTDEIVGAFVQDQIRWRDDVHFTLGTKLEWNDFSGFEWQPSARAAWIISPDHTLWGAVSRAARIPTRLERDIAVDVSDPAGDPILRLLGNPDFEAERLVAYEVGYRWRVSAAWHVDLAAFENRYDDLSSLELGEAFVQGDGRTVVPILNRNLSRGRGRGIEALITFTPFARWRLSATYSHLDLDIEAAGLDLNRGEFYEGATPRHQFALSSYLTLPGDFELDGHFRHLSDIRRLVEIPSGEGIPGYSELDLRFSWQASDRARVSLVGQNLLHERHVEFGSPDARGAIERGVYMRVEWNL